MALNPNSALVVSRNAYARGYNGDARTAAENFHRAIRLSPLDPDVGFWLNSLSFCYTCMGQYELAVDFGERSTREMPGMTATWRILAIALAHSGRLSDARSALNRMLELSPGYTIRQAQSGIFFRDPRYCELYLNGLRLAGLPE
jgi:adenylate cyclase